MEVPREGLAVVYFKADWCVPLSRYAPKIYSLIQANKDKIQFIELDFSKNKESFYFHDVTIFPTILIFEEGIQKMRGQGLSNNISLRKKLIDFINKTN